MKTLLLFSTFLAVVLFSCSTAKEKNECGPVKIIFDSDLGPDYDDVGALAFLHAMADSGKAEILATVASNKHSLVVPSIEAINTYFGRPELPVGAPKTAGVDINSPFHWADTLVARYPHRTSATAEAPDATWLYRKLLSSQPDSSVTIVTVGFLTNMSNLLDSQPDSLSPLNGSELVTRKVRLLVAMAGGFPEGREFNIYMDSTASVNTFSKWPGKVIFTGFEVGSKIFTGLRLTASAISNSPVKDVFRISMSQSEEDRNGRMSWDESAVLIAVYGTGRFFDIVVGTISVSPNGNNTWISDPSGKQSYVVMKVPPAEIAAFIEDRMMHQPIAKNTR